MTIEYDEPTRRLLSECRNYLHSDEARRAFDHLVKYAESDSQYRFVPRKQGALHRTIRYLFAGRTWSYGFIVNKSDLLFYCRKPSKRSNSDERDRFHGLGLDASMNNAGELTVRICSEMDAETVYRECISKAVGTEARDISADWSDEELRESINAYRTMQRLVRESPSTLNKKEVYRKLSERFGRTDKAFEFRMQNISAVLSLMGREWLVGLKPAAHVGKNIADRIERLLNESEGLGDPGKVAFEIDVREKRRRLPLTPPTGSEVPVRISTASQTFVRDSGVKAWVLERADGNCENCCEPAPFITPDGMPYLEVHHLRRLADGGSDRITNAVALCPNCHRRIHYGTDGEAIRSGLLARLQELRPE